MLSVSLGAAASAGAADWPPIDPDPIPPARVRGADTPPEPQPVVPAVIRRIPLGDVGFLAAGGGEPDTCLAFSPDGRRLAVGTFLGEVRVVDVYSGERIFRRKVPEAIIKQVAFSPDGKRLYYGEQSVDGFVACVELASGRVLWRHRLADDLKSGRPPRKESLYDVYQLPGCYRLLPLAGGDVLVLGIHAWGEYQQAEGLTRLSRICRLSPAGDVRWAFPSSGPMPMSLPYADADPHGRRAAVLVGYAAANTPDDYPHRPGSLVVLDGEDGSVTGSHTFEPLAPHFERVAFWQSVAVDAAGRRAAVGLEDGRAYLMGLDPVEPIRRYDFGTPVVMGGIPISARATYTHLGAGGWAYFQTGKSTVAFASTGRHVVEPPGPHPMANSLHAVDPRGHISWRYRSGHEFQDFSTSADGRWLLACVKREDQRGHEAGAMLFDTARPGGGTARLAWFYRVEGLTMFEADLAGDGSAAAVVETPVKDPATGSLVGTYQVHVVR